MSEENDSHFPPRKCGSVKPYSRMASRLCHLLAPDMANISPWKYSLLYSALRSISIYSSGVRRVFGWVDIYFENTAFRPRYLIHSMILQLRDLGSAQILHP